MNTPHESCNSFLNENTQLDGLPMWLEKTYPYLELNPQPDHQLDEDVFELFICGKKSLKEVFSSTFETNFFDRLSPWFMFFNERREPGCVDIDIGIAVVDVDVVASVGVDDVNKQHRLSVAEEKNNSAAAFFSLNLLPPTTRKIKNRGRVLMSVTEESRTNNSV